MGSEEPYYIFKICLLGPGAVGKTCIVRRYCLDTFDMNTKLTIGIDFYSSNLPVIIDGKEETIRLSIWDFGGQEQFKKMFPYYIGGANGIFTVFSLVDLQTIRELDWWYEKLIKLGYKTTPRILVGTKNDLVKTNDKSAVNELVIKRFMKRHKDTTFIKTSSKINYNIKPIFKEMTKLILEKNNFNYDEFL